MASNSDPKSQENDNATNQSQPMIVTLNQSPQAQPETMQGFQSKSPNQQALQAQPQMQYQNGYQAQSPIQQQAYGMQYQQQAQVQDTPTCCCCIPMKSGLIVIAIVGIVIGLLHIGFLGFGFTLEYLSELIYFIVPVAFMQLLYVVYIVACILLIVGAITRKWPFFWPYIVIAINSVIIDFVIASFTMYLTGGHGGMLIYYAKWGRDSDSELNKYILLFAFFVIGLIFLLSWIPVSIYFLVVVAKELKRINQT